MNLASTQFTLKNKNYEIYLAGCSAKPHCEDCHNPELWDFNVGTPIDDTTYKLIDEKVKSFDKLIDSISLMGGEPLDQDIEELKELLEHLKSLNKTLWLFTRYDLDEVPKDVLMYFDYVKCGRYYPDKKSNHTEYGVTLATSNQHIYKRGKDYT